MFTFTSHESAGRLPEDISTMFGEYNQGIIGYNLQYGDLHREHLTQSRLALKYAADAAVELAAPGTERRALLLGTGPCIDLPLRYIGGKFDRVTMVDIHTMHTVAAVKRLPPELQDKIHIVEADLTGLVGRINTDIKALGTMPTYKAFSESAVHMLEGMENDAVNAPPKLGSGYQLVSSHIVNSSLASGPAYVVEEHIRKRYGESLKDDPTMRTPLERAVLGLGGIIRASHIHYLANIVGDQGVVHYTDSYPPPDLPTIGVAAESLLRNYLNPLGELQQWHWQIKPDQEYMVAGGAFTLDAME